MKTFKKIASSIVDVLIVIIFIISLFLVISNIGVDRSKGEQPNFFGYTISSVQSESMKGVFDKGSIIVGKAVNKDTVISVGDIISFRQIEQGTLIINTHRVIAIEQDGDQLIYQTQGDNRVVSPVPDTEWKTINDITAVYKFNVPFLGSFIDFLKEPLGFVLILVIPMLAFIGFQVYKLISIYLQSKKAQMLEEAKDGVSDEAKDAIIKEYLAKMQSQQQQNDSSNKDGE